MVDTLVIGGGPAGLATAFWYRSGDPERVVLVCEAGDRPGGRVVSARCDGYLCEWGPQAVRPNPAFDELVSALGAESELVRAAAAARTRWLGSGGRLHAVPRGPLGLLASRLLPLGGRLRVLREPWIRSRPSDTESVSEFVARRFGPSAVRVVRALVAGVFAGDADELEVGASFPQLVAAEREHGSVVRGLARAAEVRECGRPGLASFRGGMATLVARLLERVDVECGRRARSAMRVGDRWVVGFEDGSEESADELVLAVPAWTAARLVRAMAPELARELDGIPSVPIVNVYLGQRTGDRDPRSRGFGFLLDPDEPTAVLGAIYASELFPDHAPAGHSLFRVMLGGRHHPRVLDASDAVLCDAAAAALQRYAGADERFDFRQVVRIDRAIPQFVRGHGARLARIERALERLPGLVLRGNSYRGIALADQLGRVEPRGSTVEVAR